MAKIEVTVPLHDYGPALWPGQVTQADLESTWREVGTPVFQTMYQGDPAGLLGDIIRREYFRYGLASDASTCFMTLDLAIKTRESNDETAVVVGNIEPLVDSGPGQAAVPLVTLRWVWHGRIGFREQIRLLTDAANYYRPAAIGMQQVAYESALVQQAQSEEPSLPFEALATDTDKYSRFYHLGAWYEFGRIQHEPHLRNGAFEQQCTSLSALHPPKHDDMADAAEMLLHFAGSTSARLTTKPGGFR